jgi:hypothetical protein
MRDYLKFPATLTSMAVMTTIFAFSPVAHGQGGQGGRRAEPGNGEPRRTAPSPTANDPFEPKDLSGIWRYSGPLSSNNAPPMTPAGKAKYDAAIPGLGGERGRDKPLGNDPIMFCDPIGFPRVLTFGAYPMEILQLPNRIIMFFDFFYTHRTIWMDGRKLEEDPEPTWYGYAVGHWDGNTLVVDSNGFNGRGWFANGGYPWSEDAKLEERYTRANHDTINVTMTLTDPATYTKPWVIGPATLKWTPKEVMREDVCAPSDEKKYLDEIREPAGRKPGQQ